MARCEDRLVGLLMLAVSTLVFTYYSVWVLVLPFVDANQGVHRLFLPREYAIIIPSVLLVLGVTAVFLFLAFVMIKSSRKAKTA